MSKVIEVKSCGECPFVNTDDQYGKTDCNLNPDIYTKGYLQLPDDQVHENCPLKKESVTVKVKEDES